MTDVIENEPCESCGTDHVTVGFIPFIQKWFCRVCIEEALKSVESLKGVVS